MLPALFFWGRRLFGKLFGQTRAPLLAIIGASDLIIMPIWQLDHSLEFDRSDDIAGPPTEIFIWDYFERDLTALTFAIMAITKPWIDEAR